VLGVTAGGRSITLSSMHNLGITPRIFKNYMLQSAFWVILSVDYRCDAYIVVNYITSRFVKKVMEAKTNSLNSLLW